MTQMDFNLSLNKMKMDLFVVDITYYDETI